MPTELEVVVGLYYKLGLFVLLQPMITNRKRNTEKNRDSF